jgi:hypothetical protein
VGGTVWLEGNDVRGGGRFGERTPSDDDMEVHEAAAAAPSGGAQRLEQRSAVRGRVEWGGSLVVAEEEEGNGSRRGRYVGYGRDTHVEAVAAWAARGAEVTGGRQHWHEVVGGDQATAALPRARGLTLVGTRGRGPPWAAGKWALLLF